MSCSGLALWLKRLTEMNMVLCSRFSKKKKKVLRLLNHQERRMERKNWFGNDSVLNVQWGTSFQRSNAYLSGWCYQQGGK